MEEEVKTLRTMKQFVAWYESNVDNTLLPASIALSLNEFYIKFKYILDQEQQDTEAWVKFLG